MTGPTEPGGAPVDTMDINGTPGYVQLLAPAPVSPAVFFAPLLSFDGTATPLPPDGTGTGGGGGGSYAYHGGTFEGLSIDYFVLPSDEADFVVPADDDPFVLAGGPG